MFPYCKLEIFIPETHLEPLRQALRRWTPGTSAAMTAACPIPL